MEKENKPITGVIKTDNITYSFYLNNYSMMFMDSTTDRTFSSTLKHMDGFASAMTHSGEKMLMHIGECDYPVCNTMKMGISSYIISTSNIFDYDLSYYDGIRFVGGTLAKLKQPRKMEIKNDGEKNYINLNNDEQRFSFKTNEFYCDVEIGSSINENRSFENHSITNGDVYFDMMFDKRQNTSSVYQHYGKIRELLSFLTNRKNVGFEKVYLLHNDVALGGDRVAKRVAEVFIKLELPLTQKKLYNNLEFELLGDSISNLMEIFYNTKERKASYSLGFYPENDESDTIITDGMVRLVCSSLECEMRFVKGIMSDEKTKIKALSKQIRAIIEAHKTSKDKLQDKTYSLIESSMSHWSMSASDQIKAVYHMYDDIMVIANKLNKVVDDEDIDAFVKYRNDITHGSYRVLDSNIAHTTYLLACLAYCCLLIRIGVPRDRIKEWFSDGRLLR